MKDWGLLQQVVRELPSLDQAEILDDILTYILEYQDGADFADVYNIIRGRV